MEDSKDKQERLNCSIGNGVDNWNYYKDCAFWNGKNCTKYKNVKQN